MLCDKTREIHRLEPKKERWAMDMTEDGRTFLASGDESVWASDILQYRLSVEHGSGGEDAECVVVNGQQVMLNDFVRRLLPTTMVSLTLGPVRECNFEVSGFLRPFDGARLRWHVLGLYSALQLQCQKGKAWKWVVNSWGRW